MSLLQNEDFTIWQLRTSYLSTIKDGVGDRLININSSILNTPGFRAAGWSSATGANAAHIKRAYSPPIPTATAVASEYFQVGGGGDVNGANRGRHGEDPVVGLGFGMVEDGEEEEGGMVTGGRDNTTIGVRQHRRAMGKKNRRRERVEHGLSLQQQRQGEVEDEDSSDLSDDSDEDIDGAQRAVQQIQFKKMPVRRTRADSSPIRSLDRRDNPDVFVTSPSLRSVNNRFRRGSLGAVEAVKARARRDTATSSDMSSENEIDSVSTRRRQIHFSTQEDVITTKDKASSERLDEEDELDGGSVEDAVDERDDDSIAESVGSALSSEFSATAGSGSLLARVGALESSSPLMLNKLPITLEPQNASPRKTRQVTSPELNVLPPPRPISTVEPVSLLSTALRARKKGPANPVEKYATLSGKGSTSTPLYIRIYVPSSSDPEEPFDMPIVRESKDSDHPGPVTVAEAIGLGLWRYMEEKLEPPLEGDLLNINRWNLRLVDDGEVEYDFPCLARNRPIIDFTSNNTRATAARGRSRSKPYDEFALVKATPEEFEENEKMFPTPAADAIMDGPEISQPIIPTNQPGTGNKTLHPGRPNPILGQPFSSALNHSTLTPADLPAVTTPHATPRMGVTKTLKVRYVGLEATQITSMNTSTDSYIAEILDSVCKKWGLDKGNYLLKVMGSNTIAPLDRTVEALGNITDLELVRRRFGAGPLSLTGSPGSSSPNAPLRVENQANAANAKKSKKGGGRMLHPLAQTQDLIGGYYRRYNVIRKQSMSFTASNQRVLAFDTDYMHIMPAETGKTLFESNTKTTSISFSDVVGSKVSRRHPKSFRVVVLRGNEASEQKRYDFEAKNAVEAAEIVDEIKKNMMQYHV
ncbi:hypothetical protein FQN52_009549 [Onygenales sp. PD_12]|nr:hypothetical protein FQN52_009549 [Onygenales sp. PD_12]